MSPPFPYVGGKRPIPREAALWAHLEEAQDAAAMVFAELHPASQATGDVRMIYPHTTFGKAGSVVSILVQHALSSGCDKSARGVVLACSWGDGHVWSGGTNRLPPGSRCLKRDVCGRQCRDIAVHAEMAALMTWPLHGTPPTIGFHGKVDRATQRLVPTGGPSCVQCSKHLVHAGLEHFWLYQTVGTIEAVTVDEVLPPTADGGAWVRYKMPTFHDASMVANGLGAFVEPASCLPVEYTSSCERDEGVA